MGGQHLVTARGLAGGEAGTKGQAGWVVVNGRNIIGQRYEGFPESQRAGPEAQSQEGRSGCAGPGGARGDAKNKEYRQEEPEGAHALLG